jgi:hypothetical protein
MLYVTGLGSTPEWRGFLWRRGGWHEARARDRVEPCARPNDLHVAFMSRKSEGPPDLAAWWAQMLELG